MTFPSSVKHITFDGALTSNIDNLPSTVEELSFNEIHTDITNLPISIKKIHMINNRHTLDTSDRISRIPFGCVIIKN
ncbi:MAG: hypothetical protein Gaeavirus3_4 [Gaeavirus sp.]|uniref:Uncharacterized protein n=1 Tax=Gaeavirus sp. TaxID=2487767 RepID=A0A3G4ZYL6_9VIRU|nr:MAG: hypothetical protein Gaeavirus3_4 [Gaeavirus sp.]